jgi:transcription antitermination protein NusB
MLGRRSLRIKVMQILYSWEVNPDVQFGTLSSALDKNIDRSTELYLTNLAYLCEICQYATVDAAKRMAKMLRTEEDMNANTNIAANPVIIYIQQHPLYIELMKRHKIHHYIDQDVVKSLFHHLRDKYSYKEYIKIAQPTLEQDKEVLGLIVKKLMLRAKEMEQNLEDNFINFDDDQLLLNHVLLKFVEAFDGTDTTALVSSLQQWEEERKFGSDLLKLYFKHNDELLAHIQPNLQNWEVERIAIMDMVLMKMAVCELLYFPTVPVKVSINEYIDISKIYSTPKSKDFVNGVLDKTKDLLLSEGLIQKQGRGLVDS